MIKELGGGGGAARAPVAAPAAPASGGVSAAEATRVVLAVLAAKTGYEPDMIEMDMALEKELNVEAQDVAALARTQTVGEVVEAMIAELRNVGGGGSAPAARAPAPAPAAASSGGGGGGGGSSGVSAEEATRVVLAVLA